MALHFFGMAIIIGHHDVSVRGLSCESGVAVSNLPFSFIYYSTRMDLVSYKSTVKYRSNILRYHVWF